MDFLIVLMFVVVVSLIPAAAEVVAFYLWRRRLKRLQIGGVVSMPSRSVWRGAISPPEAESDIKLAS